MSEMITKISQGSIEIIIYITSALGAGVVFVLGFIFRHEKAISANKKDIQDIKEIPIMTTPVCDARYLAHKDKLEEIHRDVRMLTSKLIPDSIEKK